MKLVTAIVRPEQLPDVKQALVENHVYKMTVSNCIGAGEEKGYTEIYRGGVAEVDLLNKVRVDIGVNDDFVEPTVNAIVHAARTGEVGDGKIFVTDLDDCVRIRTGERGTTAIG